MTFSIALCIIPNCAYILCSEKEVLRYLAHGDTVKIKVSLVKEEDNFTSLTATKRGSFPTLSLCIAETLLRYFVQTLQSDMLQTFSVTLYETSFIEIGSFGVLNKTKT
jgi:hypothetical protein